MVTKAQVFEDDGQYAKSPNFDDDVVVLKSGNDWLPYTLVYCFLYSLKHSSLQIEDVGSLQSPWYVLQHEFRSKI